MVPGLVRRAMSRRVTRNAVAAVAATALVLGAAPALAATALPALPAGCTQSGITVTCTYTSLGESQFAVPQGVTTVSATVVGGQGGEDFGLGDPGGLGAVASGSLSVTPGQVLFAEVGILGGAAGQLLPGFSDSGAGGGESDVRTCPSAGGQPCAAGSTLASRLLVAGGGGGRGDFGGTPGNAGTNGSAGSATQPGEGRNGGGGGTGATATAPGQGGSGCDGGGNGSPGATAGGNGGNAGPANSEDGVSGGGGGGGWFGGGAGGGCANANDYGGSGGGGTSHAANTVGSPQFSQASSGQTPSVTISYQTLGVTTTTLPDGTVGGAYSENLSAAGGNSPYSWSLASGSSLPSGLNLSSGGTISGTPQAAGTFNFTVQVADSSSPQLTATQPESLFIAKASTITELEIDPDGQAAVGDTITLSADILTVPGGGPLPNGTVTFTANGDTVCNNVPATGGFALCTINLNSPGTYSITGTYSGDSNYTGSADTDSTYMVNKAGARPSISIQPTSGATVDSSITATVSLQTNGTAEAPTGTVSFAVNGSTVSGCGSVTVVSQKATCPVGNLGAGSYTIAATYNGDGNYVASQTEVTGYQVGLATPNVGLSASPSSGATPGTPVTLTANVAGSSGAPTATGAVAFTVDGTTVPGCGSVAVTSGSAQCSVGDLPIGTYSLAANYSGDGNYLSASGTITGYQVAQETPVVGLSASPSSGAGIATPVTLTASVTGQGPSPSGTVTFSANGVTVPGCGSVPVTSGSATCPAGTLPAGTYTFEADYSGDTNYTADSGSLSGYQVAQATPGVSLSATPSSGATVTSPVGLSATVVPIAGGPAPTGTVTFLVNGSPQAGCIGLSLASATCSLGTLAAGSYNFQATYSGDTNYIAASGSITSYGVSTLASAVSVDPTVPAPVWGQGESFTATVTSGGSPVIGGVVQWQVGGTNVGSPVAVGADGTATLGPLTNLPVGSDQVTAEYSGTAVYSANSGQDDLAVGQASTMTSIAVTGKQLTSTVKAVAPGAGIPTGTVTFTVNGQTVGTANLSAKGVATLPYTSAGSEVAAASYGGSTDFLGSSASTSTTNPVITAKVTSTEPETRFDWFHSPVTVTFTCKKGSAALTAPCPAPVTLSHNGAAQSVTRTIHATDGGIATVTVSPINIDQTAPVITVSPLRNGGYFEAPGPTKATCTAKSLSGLASPCKVTVLAKTTVITWTATATSQSGLTTTVHGQAKLFDYYIAGVPEVGGFFQTPPGHSYLVRAYVVTKVAPLYVYAAPLGSKPYPVGPAMKKIGTNLWGIEINVTASMRKHQYWNLGVYTGGKTHIIQIQLFS
jgi:large repetitive protein